jgi:cob(I)alamin adenosyltransferase
MKVYTKTGDKGTTALFGGARVSKAHFRIEAYGTVDELNAFIGMLRDQEVNQNRKVFLKAIQDRLFTIGSLLAADPEKANLMVPDLHKADIEDLEREMDDMDKLLPPMRNFILPGGHPSVSFAHIARTVCRRAERRVVVLNEKEKTFNLVLEYLNRLSDFLFVLSRLMGLELKAEEVAWSPRKP